MKKIAYMQMYENELNHGWYLGTRRHLVKTLKQYSQANSKILDAGAGTGGTIKLLEQAGFKNIIGIEKSDTAIGYAKQRGLSVKKGDINKLRFEKDSFDIIICLDVLYHQGVDPVIAVKEFHRVLKKGELLYIQEPAYNFLRSRHDEAISTERRFTKDQVGKILNSAGFEIIRLSYFNTLMFIPISLKRLLDRLAKKDEISSDVDSLNPILNRLIAVSLNLESNLLKYISLPFGLSVICLAKKT